MKTNDDIKQLDEKTLEQDDENIRKLLKYRKLLTYKFKVSFLVGTLIKLVKKSEFITFYNKRAETFINKKKPVLKVKIKLTKKLRKTFHSEKIENHLQYFLNNNKISTFTNHKELYKIITDYKINIIQNEVFDPFLTILFEELKNLEKDDKELVKSKKEIYEIFPEMKDLKNFFLPSIFKVLVETDYAELIFIEYII